jgi:hypothetical protein
MWSIVGGRQRRRQLRFHVPADFLEDARKTTAHLLIAEGEIFGDGDDRSIFQLLGPVMRERVHRLRRGGRGANAQFDTTLGPFQITKPPQGDAHPRGFVQATVLKTVTEHPQGMTTPEITAELSRQGIGRESIANALGALVQAGRSARSARGTSTFLLPPKCRPHPISQAHDVREMRGMDVKKSGSR